MQSSIYNAKKRDTMSNITSKTHVRNKGPILIPTTVWTLLAFENQNLKIWKQNHKEWGENNLLP